MNFMLSWSRDLEHPDFHCFFQTKEAMMVIRNIMFRSGQRCWMFERKDGILVRWIEID